MRHTVWWVTVAKAALRRRRSCLMIGISSTGRVSTVAKTPPGFRTLVIAVRRACWSAAGMTLHGRFTVDDAEWWHFDRGNQSWAMRSGVGAARYGEVNEVRPHGRRDAVGTGRTA